MRNDGGMGRWSDGRWSDGAMHGDIEEEAGGRCAWG